MESENDTELPSSDNNNRSPISPHHWMETVNYINQTQMKSNHYNTQQQTLLTRHQKHLLRDSSFQSDDSYCSSVESVLELRRPDPEEVLLGLGFGPKKGTTTTVGKIPTRFLQPSKLIPNVDFNKFLEKYCGEQGTDLPQSSTTSPIKPRPKSN